MLASNRNDVIVARHTVAHLLDSGHMILGDGGYRGIRTITSPRRDTTGRIVQDNRYRRHRRIRARVEHVIARLKDWQILRQCRRRGQAIDHSLQIITGLWNLKLAPNYGSSLSGDRHHTTARGAIRSQWFVERRRQA